MMMMMMKARRFNEEGTGYDVLVAR